MTGSNLIKVLIIDNDDTFLDAARDALTEEDYEVLTARDGEQGMNIIRENRDIDVVLLDLLMPGISGEEVLGRLKGDPDCREIPVVVVTTDRDIRKEMEMLDAGADRFIVKNVSADELVSVVRDVTKSYKVLIIEDDHTFLNAVRDVLMEEDYEVLTTRDGKQGMNIIKENRDIDVILLDLHLPDILGEEVLRRLKENPDYKEMPVIIVTAERSIDKTMEMKAAGAIRVISKSVTADELILIVQDVIASPKTHTPPPHQSCMEVGWTGVSYDPEKGDTLQGKSDTMISLMEKKIFPITQSKLTVLISGETGTGKELVAREIHYLSNRKDGPFVALNCGALAEGVLESELFGHEKGAFSGAVKLKLGKFELAHRGTILLDEIGEISAAMQVNLLRVLQESEFQRVGGEKTIKVDVRVIAATKKNLEEMVRRGEFREDLYYRLNVYPVRLPPLRERRQAMKAAGTLASGEPTPISDDIEVLTDYAMSKYNKKDGAANPVKWIEVLAIESLKVFGWPGNVRQLNNVVTRAAITASQRQRNGIITKEDIEKSIREDIKAEDAPNTNTVQETSSEIALKDLHKNIREGDQQADKLFADGVREILNQAGGNKTKASELAGISRPTLDKYIEEAKEIYPGCQESNPS